LSWFDPVKEKRQAASIKSAAAKTQITPLRTIVVRRCRTLQASTSLDFFGFT
jgi:hypothetical protein